MTKSTAAIAVKTRKERRKEERLAKRSRKQSPAADVAAHSTMARDNRGVAVANGPTTALSEKQATIRSESSSDIVKKKKPAAALTVGSGRKISSTSLKDPYAHLDADVAAALRRDDEEIAALEAKLNVKGKDKRRLKREYAQLECYGDDFGDFLDDLDQLSRRIVMSNDHDNGEVNEKYRAFLDGSKNGHSEEDDDDFDHDRALDDSYYSDEDDDEADDVDDETDEELVPMKDPANDMDDNDWDDDDDDEHDVQDNKYLDDDDEDQFEGDPSYDGIAAAKVGSGGRREEPNGSMQRADEDEEDIADENDEVGDEDDIDENEEEEVLDDEDVGGDDDEEDDQDEPDHDASLTYRPAKGEDIYGKSIEPTEPQSQPQKYVPPHLRKSTSTGDKSGTMEGKREESDTIRNIMRALNNALNRLSEDKLVPVVQSIAQLYDSFAAHDVNECYWNITQTACLSRDHLMTGLAPVFVAALCGVHLHKGDSAQLAEFILEKLVVDLWNGLSSAREISVAVEDDGETANDGDEGLIHSKEVGNLALLLCYFYNFGLVHCTLLYDIIRALIESCCEVDVEILLLLLNHCGRALRSDDTTAIKEIVLLVQQKALDKSIRSKISASRCDYLVSAITDLKNNKRARKQQDQQTVHMDKTIKLRKTIGHIKSSIAASTKSQRAANSDASLRITLQDVLDAETKGRWWKVGASWAGHHRQVDPTTVTSTESATVAQKKERASPQRASEDVDESILRLAAKYRMNTDARRTVFCIIMGSLDYEDCFEKLVRAEALKNRSERDTVRVLMECCGNESSFNKFHALLAARICEYQQNSKFTFQLAFWDTFKQFKDLKARKVANLAKLLYHLVAVHNCLKINVIKAIDMAEIDELPETAMIFVTIFLSSLLEHFDDPGDVARLFAASVARSKGGTAGSMNSDDEHEDPDLAHMDDTEALQANLTVFLVQVLKASPKNKKGSTFRANLKAAIKACDSDNFF